MPSLQLTAETPAQCASFVYSVDGKPVGRAVHGNYLDAQRFGSKGHKTMKIGAIGYSLERPGEESEEAPLGKVLVVELVEIRHKRYFTAYAIKFLDKESQDTYFKVRPDLALEQDNAQQRPAS